MIRLALAGFTALLVLAFTLSEPSTLVHSQTPSATVLTTPWTAKVDPAAPLPAYPRPQLEREGWTNLNGSWEYVVRARELNALPDSYDGKILVPFPIESYLSGVQRRVSPRERLWYRRAFFSPELSNSKRLLLHFGAVDWQTEVIVNGHSVGRHEGGYDPFTFDITEALKPAGAQQLIVAVWDPTDDGAQPRGKQVNKPNRIWYTPVTGIWQTVWLEAVPQTYISATRNTPDIDNRYVMVRATVENQRRGDRLRVAAWDGRQKVAERKTDGTEAVLQLKAPRLWSPASPFLYSLRIAVIRQGRIIDEVKSYFALRKISIAPDRTGTQRILVNNRLLYQYGPLDQGWWPDGLYTAPTDEALRFDIEQVKAMGFNLIRKHVKVEPARWYYDCDRLGVLVWQDMPSGDLGNRWDSRPGIIGVATEKSRNAESEKIYRTEWKAIIDALYNFPSIVVWVPFNEAWGQFKTEEITRWTIKYDHTRLVNSASGGNFSEVGHIIDLHNYPDPAMPRPDMFGKRQAIVLGEFGGLGLPVQDHLWQRDKNWGYREFKDPAEVEVQYSALLTRLRPLIARGLSAAVYTQLTDVEGEVNGLMTYDRRVVKIPVEQLAAINRSLFTIRN